MEKMRRLLLLRHAKSAWNQPGLSDIDRPLNQRGTAIAPLVGAYMKDEGLLPDYALVSTAKRTRQTWQLLSSVWGEVRHGFDERLYETYAKAILAIIKANPAQLSSLLIVGHNPGLQELAVILARQEKSKTLRSLTDHFPTTALCVLDFEVDEWEDIIPGLGVIERYVTPRSLGLTADDD